MTPNLNNPNEVSQEGKRIYESQYREEFEKEYLGKYVAIDVIGGSATAGQWPSETMTEAAKITRAGSFSSCASDTRLLLKSPHMASQNGYLDGKGQPRLKIRVFGTSPGAFADVDALTDTGFAGFLMLPLAQALPLGLVLRGMVQYALADGTPATYFEAEGAFTVASPASETLTATLS